LGQGLFWGEGVGSSHHPFGGATNSI